jgi:hypothetical protein
MTAYSLYDDYQKGNYYTLGTRLAINGGIIAVSTICAPCGFVLSIGESAFGDHLYDYVENNFDK